MKKNIIELEKNKLLGFRIIENITSDKEPNVTIIGSKVGEDEKNNNEEV